MTMRLTQKELDDLQKRHGRWAQPAKPAAAGGQELLQHLLANKPASVAGLRHKFHAVRTERDGFKFPSKMEAAFYDKCKQEQAAGLILFFLMQVPFKVPGSPQPIAFWLDFMVFAADGNVYLDEVKGQPTEAFKLKRRLVEHHFKPAKLRLWKLKGTTWEMTE